MSAEAHQRSHLFRTDEPIDEQYLLFHSKLLGQGLQLKPVAISFPSPDLRVSGARNHVKQLLWLAQDARHGLNYAFRTLCLERADQTLRRTLLLWQEKRFLYRSGCSNGRSGMP